MINFLWEPQSNIRFELKNIFQPRETLHSSLGEKSELAGIQAWTLCRQYERSALFHHHYHQYGPWVDLSQLTQLSQLPLASLKLSYYFSKFFVCVSITSHLLFIQAISFCDCQSVNGIGSAPSSYLSWALLPGWVSFLSTSAGCAYLFGLPITLSYPFNLFYRRTYYLFYCLSFIHVMNGSILSAFQHCYGSWWRTVVSYPYDIGCYPHNFLIGDWRFLKQKIYRLVVFLSNEIMLPFRRGTLQLTVPAFWIIEGLLFLLIFVSSFGEANF